MSSLTIKKMKSILKENGVKGYSKLNSGQLKEVLEQYNLLPIPVAQPVVEETHYIPAEVNSEEQVCVEKPKRGRKKKIIEE